jgi:hypothetical protein
VAGDAVTIRAGTAFEFVFFSKAIVCSVALVDEEAGVEFAAPAKRERSQVTFNFPQELIGQTFSLRFARETVLSRIEVRGLFVVNPMVQWPAAQFHVENVAVLGKERACDEVIRATAYKFSSGRKLSQVWISVGDLCVQRVILCFLLKGEQGPLGVREAFGSAAQWAEILDQIIQILCHSFEARLAITVDINGQWLTGHWKDVHQRQKQNRAGLESPEKEE